MNSLRPGPAKYTQFGYIKPHLYKENGVWICHDNFFVVARGENPSAAFKHWQTKEKKRSTIPRYGVWERRGARDWHDKGCPRIRSYIGCRQIVGYDPKQDLLILRG